LCIETEDGSEADSTSGREIITENIAENNNISETDNNLIEETDNKNVTEEKN
jgi:hypothetical protein